MIRKYEIENRNEVVREWYYIRKKDERNRTFNK